MAIPLALYAKALGRTNLTISAAVPTLSSPTSDQGSVSLKLLTNGQGQKGQSGISTTPDTYSDITAVYARPLLAGIGSSFHARLTVVSGDAPDGGDAVGSWLWLNTEREWIMRTVGDYPAGVWRLALSGDGGSSIITSGDFNIFIALLP